MSDVQVMKIVDVIVGAPIQDTTVDGVRTVRLQLWGLATYVAEVSVGGYLTSYSVAGENLLDVVVPSNFADTSADDLSILVLSSGRTFNAAAYEILFDLGTDSRAVSGNDYLIQKFLRFLLMTRGTDKKDKNAGAGLLQIAGSIVPANLETSRPVVARIFNDAKRQVIDRQTAYLDRLQRSEILRDAALVRVALDEDNRLLVEGVLMDGAGMPLTVGTRL